MIIVGAGLSGLIAAHAFPGIEVHEADNPGQKHTALLRFRGDSVSRVTNIPFRRVTVRKGIFDIESRTFVQPNILNSNQYSMKVIGELRDRSIWNLAAVERYIAPEDFYMRMVDALGQRIHWKSPIDLTSKQDVPVISTIPLYIHRPKFPQYDENFRRAQIYVQRYRIDGSDVHQTIYYPHPMFPVYRASITGDILTVELTDNEDDVQWLTEVCDSFGIADTQLEFLGSSPQRFGKIAPIAEGARRRMVIELSRDYKIYSLGRFATWRNILLDDVVKDIDVIKSLLSSDEYDGRLISHGERTSRVV